MNYLTVEKARKRGLEQMTDWFNQNDPIKVLSNKQHPIAKCTYCSKVIFVRKSVEISALHWMESWVDRVNKTDKWRKFTIVRHKSKEGVFALFAKPVKTDYEEPE